MNDYSWNLNSDVIVHKTHLSKNWDKNKQKEYRHWYYLNVEKKNHAKASVFDGSKEHKKSVHLVNKYVVGGADAITKPINAYQESHSGVGKVEMNPGNDTDKRGRKYIAKINTGKYIRYFYTQHELDVYNQQISLATNENERREVLDLFETYDILPEEESEDESAKAINPNFSIYNPDTSMNCQFCSEAYDMRRRGFNVKAVEKRNMGGYNETFDEPDIYNYDNPGGSTRDDYSGKSYVISEDGDTYTSEAVDKATDSMLKDLHNEGPGASGFMYIKWGYGENSGHAINWYNYRGTHGRTITAFRDAQDYSKDITPDRKGLQQYAGRSDEIGYVRTDNQIPRVGVASRLERDVVPITKPYLEENK